MAVALVWIASGILFLLFIVGLGFQPGKLARMTGWLLAVPAVLAILY